jgi:hypothetical protein
MHAAEKTDLSRLKSKTRKLTVPPSFSKINKKIFWGPSERRTKPCVGDVFSAASGLYFVYVILRVMTFFR